MSPKQVRRLRLVGAMRKSVVPRDKRKLASDPLAYSLESQRNKLSALSAAHDFTGWAEDEGVSGSVSPFKRPHLGPWFGRLEDWDGLAVARFDRISRSVADFSALCEWLKEHGKVLICLDPPIDLSTPGGRAFAQMLAVFAEYERELIKARVGDKWNELRDAGKWMGGPVPFGRMPVNLGGSWALVPDPQLQPVVFGMASHYVAGSSFGMIADWLNAEEVIPAKDAQRKRTGRELLGDRWDSGTVADVLRNPSLGGFVSANGGLRRDSDGMLIRIEPLIPEDLYQRLQVALTDRSYRRRNASKLRGVAFCFMCGGPLHSMPTSKGGSDHRWEYYGCWGLRTGQCRTARIPAAYLEELAAEYFLGTVGDQFIREPMYIAGTDHSAELASVVEAIGNLEDEYAAGNVYAGPDGAERFAGLMSRLEERRARLAAIDIVPARTEYRETRTTFAERWEELDDQGRQLLMADSGFRVYCARVPVPPEEIARQTAKIGISATTRELSVRAGNLAAYLRRRPASPRVKEWRAELAEVERQRARLREIPRYQEYVLAPTGDRLKLRAGLASAGQVTEHDSEESWAALLAPARRALLRSS